MTVKFQMYLQFQVYLTRPAGQGNLFSSVNFDVQLNLMPTNEPGLFRLVKPNSSDFV